MDAAKMTFQTKRSRRNPKLIHDITTWIQEISSGNSKLVEDDLSQIFARFDNYRGLEARRILWVLIDEDYKTAITMLKEWRKSIYLESKSIWSVTAPERLDILNEN